MSNNSFTAEEMLAMDKIAEEMRAKGHNGTKDYYSGGWRCYNACRACGHLCDCGAAWFEGHAHDCLKNPDNNPFYCPKYDRDGIGCGLCKNNNKDCGRQKMFPAEVRKIKRVKMEVDITVTEDGVFRVELPNINSSSKLGQMLTNNLGEVQPGFGQLTANKSWVKVVHWPALDEQEEGFGILLFFNYEEEEREEEKIDTSKVRRRIEDALRKDDDKSKLLITANLYNVKVD